MKERPHEEGPVRRHEQHSYLHVPHHWRSSRDVRHLRWLNPHLLELHDPRTDATYRWSSRAHRKHRYVHVQPHKPGVHVKRPRYRLFGFDWSNISWWIAQLFLWGSMCWVINGWFLFLPTSHENLNLYMAGYSALAGGTLFWFGAYLSVVEAVNTDPQVTSPSKLLHMADGDLEAGDGNGKQLDSGRDDAQPNVNGVSSDMNGSGVSSGLNGSSRSEGLKGDSDSSRVVPLAKPRYRWWGWRWHDIGYIAVFLQFVGATLFQVSVITGTPHVLPDESSTNWWTWDAAFWALQIVGAWGFILSAIVFMLESQDEWWKVAPLRIGWQVGVWNLIGAIGFEASPIGGMLDYPSEVPQRWITYFSTYWGGWAFLIGSYAQLLECLNKHPRDMGHKKSTYATS